MAVSVDILPKVGLLYRGKAKAVKTMSKTWIVLGADGRRYEYSFDVAVDEVTARNAAKMYGIESKRALTPDEIAELDSPKNHVVDPIWLVSAFLEPKKTDSLTISAKYDRASKLMPRTAKRVKQAKWGK